MVPENRRLFGYLSVEENLRLGAYHRDARRELQATQEEVLDLFPRLRERSPQRAGTLSGGEQQMCAIARGLMARPKLLIFDEPSLGLAPIIVEQVFDLIEKLISGGLTVLLVEQNVAEAVSIADRVSVIEQGSVTIEGSGHDFLENEAMRAAYLGPA
jgi:branched-chain amino acid transport system ATP-binding protein